MLMRRAIAASLAVYGSDDAAVVPSSPLDNNAGRPRLHHFIAIEFDLFLSNR